MTVRKGRNHSAQKEQGRGPEGCHLWPREETKDRCCKTKKCCRREKKSLAWQHEFQPFKQIYFPTLWRIIQIPVLTPVQQQAQSFLFRSLLRAASAKGQAEVNYKSDEMTWLIISLLSNHFTGLLTAQLRQSQVSTAQKLRSYFWRNYTKLNKCIRLTVRKTRKHKSFRNLSKENLFKTKNWNVFFIGKLNSRFQFEPEVRN